MILVVDQVSTIVKSRGDTSERSRDGKSKIKVVHQEGKLEKDQVGTIVVDYDGVIVVNQEGTSTVTNKR